MKETFTEQFIGAAGTEAVLAKRVVKTLEANGITSMDILLAKDTKEIQSIKGIGEQALCLLGKIMTKERMKREKKMDIYKKAQGCPKPHTLCEWLQSIGVYYTEARQLEVILKKNGIKTIDDFMKTTDEWLMNLPRIGEKRMETIHKVKIVIKRRIRCKK